MWTEEGGGERVSEPEDKDLVRKGRLKTGEREETGGTGKKKDKERERCRTLVMIRFPRSRAHKHKVIQKTKTEMLKAAVLKNQSKMDLMHLPPK